MTIPTIPLVGATPPLLPTPLETVELKVKLPLLSHHPLQQLRLISATSELIALIFGPDLLCDHTNIPFGRRCSSAATHAATNQQIEDVAAVIPRLSDDE